MPLIDIEVIEGVFDAATKARLIQGVTDAVVAVEGEAMRPVTWVRIKELRSGDWAIGGQALTSDAVRKMASG